MNKVIVISGGSRGIGKAIAQKFAQKEFDIITCSRSQNTLDQLIDDIEKGNDKINCSVFKADLSVRDEVESFLDFIRTKTSRVDVLVNNAGIFIPGEIHKEEDGILENMINTNLYSAYHLSRGIIPIMIKNKQGHIFNMCSTASIIPYTNGGSYCISKFALYGMSKVLREELKPYGLRVTSVLPGAVLTDSWEGMDLPEERFIKPEDIADTVYSAWGISDQSVIEELIVRPQLGDI